MNTTRTGGKRVRATMFAIAALATYALGRQRLLRWGATDNNVAQPYPGVDLIQDGERSTATMAITIDALPAKVWPWLVQMGCGRGGWYSFDHLDNWGAPSADRIYPEWQDVNLGDHLRALPDGSGWWEVAAFEPEHFLGLRMSLGLNGQPFDPNGPRPRLFTDSLWGFLLEELPGARTRLVVSGYWAFEPHWLQPILTVLLYEPTHWIMQMRQFANLKRRVESAELTELSDASPSRVPSEARAAA